MGRKGPLKSEAFWGRLGGSVGEASDFGSGHDLTVHRFEPRVGLCADGSEPGACFGFRVSLSLPFPAHAHALSPSKISKNIKKELKSEAIWLLRVQNSKKIPKGIL